MQRNKYGARKVVVDGEIFHSTGEAMRHRDLTLLERAGEIRDLKRQPVFNLVVNNILICKFTLDWQYTEGHRQCVEDFKGVKVRDYRIKKKLFHALFPHIEFIETGKEDLSR